MRNKSEIDVEVDVTQTYEGPIDGPDGKMMFYGSETKEHFVTVMEYPSGAVGIELVSKKNPDAPIRFTINGVHAILEPHHRRSH